MTCLTLMSFITGYSLVLPVSAVENGSRSGAEARPGDKVSVFANCDFSKDNWKAYLVLSSDDLNDLHPLIKKQTCLMTTDPNVLNEMKKSWRFRVTGGDVATVESAFYLFKNNKLIYKTGIILDKTSQRLQNSEYGELIPVDAAAMLNSCKQFKSVYWPVVVL